VKKRIRKIIELDRAIRERDAALHTVKVLRETVTALIELLKDKL
jgi:hypothetical protein